MSVRIREDRLGAGAAACLRAWLAQCSAEPGALPPSCERVQGRLVRVVGRGDLPGAGPVFVKLMAFPRLRDRLRYLHRPLPAEHEAAALEQLRARAPDQPCPEPLGLLAERRALGAPRLSVLVTRGLPVDERRPTLTERARAAARLCAVGIEHADLHVGNFVALTDGRTAVLDLQSARVHGGPLPRRLRLSIAAKLAEDAGADGLGPLVEAGLVEAADLPAVAAAAARLRDLARARRIRRALTASTEFVVRRGPFGFTALRRGVAAAAWVAAPRARQLWIGDRALEVLDGEVPRFAGYRRPWLGRAQLLVRAGRIDEWQADRARLLAACGSRSLAHGRGDAVPS